MTDGDGGDKDFGLMDHPRMSTVNMEVRVPSEVFYN